MDRRVDGAAPTRDTVRVTGWEERRVRLPADHGWQTRPGWRIVVADRGAVRFDVPGGWTAGPGEDGSLRLHDRPPPDDNCRLELSVLRLPIPPGQGPPLADLLAGVTRGDGLDVRRRSAPVLVRRGALEAVWNETRHHEADEDRDALWRCCIARGRGVHALLTMSLWADDADGFAPVWQGVLASLELGARYDLSGRDPQRN